MTTKYDAIVVGVGGVGSAATYHLARRGLDVLGLERYDVPHSMGSSHGVTRIIRKAYYERPEYLPLLERSYDLWRDLDDGHSSDLLHVNGSVVAGPPGGEKVEDALATCRQYDLDYELLSGDELGDRYPGYGLPEAFRAVVQPDGGFLHSEQCVVAHVEAAHRHGATVRARERVVDWSTTGEGVRVETDKASHTADRLVVAAGAWASKLVPELGETAVPERQVLAWFQPSSPNYFDPGTFPVFTMDSEEGYFYGFPRYHVPGFKLGKYNHFHETVDPDDRSREPTRADERMLREFTERYFPDAAGPTMRLETCMFTNSPDEDFVIDVHPEHPEVVVAAGFSGHGFKMTPAIGELVADLVVDGDSDLPTGIFSLDRF